MPRRLHNLISMLAAERRARARLEQMQLERLRALLHDAYLNVPGYRDLWRAHGVQPRDVQRLEDLERLPVIDKRDMREAGVERFVDRRHADERGLLRRCTSGSSGAPFEFLVSRAENQWRKAQRLRPYVSNGVWPWHRALALTGSEDAPRTLAGVLGCYAERRVRGARPAEELLRELVRVRPHVLTGYPSALNQLAGEILARGGGYPRPKLVFTDSEMLAPYVRARLREAFGTDPIDVYGTFETENIAFQCAERAGLHVAMESAIVEIVADGRPAAPGTQGEVVVTVLNAHVMPFIRYNLHDVSAYAPEPCGCGRTLPVLQAVQGRSDDSISLPGGGRCSAIPLLLDFDALAPWVLEYRIVQRDVHSFDVYVRPVADMDAAAGRVERIFAQHVPGARLALIERRESLERDPSGKLRCFINATLPAGAASAAGRCER